MSTARHRSLGLALLAALFATTASARDSARSRSIRSPSAQGSSPRRYPWQKDPGPIAGRWGVSCPGSAGMILEVTVRGKTEASGRVAALGRAGRYGYAEGEEILRLQADDFGDWVGELKWRNVRGVIRWDPIRMVASAERLKATMTTDPCYKDMPRVH
jgi:hypothetical protein